MNNTFKAFRTLYSVLPKRLRRKVIFTGINSFVMIGLDLLGVGLLLPLLVMVLGENNILENPYLSYFFELSPFQSAESFMWFILIIVVFIALARLLLSSLISYRQTRMLFDISQYLSLKLYRIYYNNGFLFVKSSNSHRLISRVEGIASYLIQGYFIPFVSLISESVVTIIVFMAFMFCFIKVF